MLIHLLTYLTVFQSVSVSIFWVPFVSRMHMCPFIPPFFQPSIFPPFHPQSNQSANPSIYYVSTPLSQMEKLRKKNK